MENKISVIKPAKEIINTLWTELEEKRKIYESLKKVVVSEKDIATLDRVIAVLDELIENISHQI